MNGDGSDNRILIKIAAGNLRNHYIYLTGPNGFFPRRCYGKPSKRDGTGEQLLLVVKGLAEPVKTDLSPRGSNGTSRCFFRNQRWVRDFFTEHKIKEGDSVAVEKLGEMLYRVYPYETSEVHRGVRQFSLPQGGDDMRGRQLNLFSPPGVVPETQTDRLANGSKNKLFPEDRTAHDWYRFVLSYPPQLVREYVHRFGLASKDCVLDPFCGTGTTLVECKKLSISSIGLEAHPMAALASEVKTNWGINATTLVQRCRAIAEKAGDILAHDRGPLRALPADTHRLLLKNSISPRPLHKTLALLEQLAADAGKAYYHHARLALASALVKDIGNLHFGPEVGVRNIKEDADVLGLWEANVAQIAEDLKELQAGAAVSAQVYCHDSRTMIERLDTGSVDAIITSPPYPNEKDYTRTTRLETVLLGFICNRKDLRVMKQDLLRSNSRNVYKGDTDHEWVDSFPQIKRIAEEIEQRRIALGKTSGFERMYARVTVLYFGGMARHLAALRRVLRPGAHLAYVVGDQASFLRVMIRTGQLLAQIADSLGYEVESIDLFRTRLATATKEQMREEVLVLKWPG